MDDKTRLDCGVFEEKLDRYVRGELPEPEAELVKEHGRSCSECAAKLEQAEDLLFLQNNNRDDLPDVKKLESRFSRRISIRVIGSVFLAAILVYLVFGTLFGALQHPSVIEKSEALQYALGDLIRFTMPGAEYVGGYGGSSTFEITRSAEFRQVLLHGSKEGTIDMELPLLFGSPRWNFKSNILYPDPQTEGTERTVSDFDFNAPQVTNESLLNKQWDTLEQILKLGSDENSARTKIAIYFGSPVTTDAMSELLRTASADNHHTWLAIDIGVGADNYGKTYPELMDLTPQWGFPTEVPLTPATATTIKRDEQGRIVTMSMQNSENNVTDAAVKFKKEMEQFEKYSGKYFKAPVFTADVKAVNRYLSEKGVYIKGAVLKGLTKDLLKLKEEKNIVRMDILVTDIE